MKIGKARPPLKESELERIRMLREQGNTTLFIALQIGRTEKAVCNALKKMNISTFKVNTWKEEDNEIFVSMWNGGYTPEEIGAKLSRTRTSVIQHAVKLRNEGVDLMKKKTGRKKSNDKRAV